MLSIIAFIKIAPIMKLKYYVECRSFHGISLSDLTHTRTSSNLSVTGPLVIVTSRHSVPG